MSPQGPRPPLRGLPEAVAAVRERRCSGCGLVSRFAEGFEPDWSGWQDDRCPACARAEMAERASDMTRAEQMELVEKALKDGAQPRAIADTLGLTISAVEGKRRWLVSHGVIDAPTPRRGGRRKPRKPKLYDAVLADVISHPGTDRRSMVARLGSNLSTVGRCLRHLIAEGRIERKEEWLGRGGGKRVTYRTA